MKIKLKDLTHNQVLELILMSLKHLNLQEKFQKNINLLLKIDHLNHNQLNLNNNNKLINHLY